MSKLKKWLGKTVVATAVGVVSLQASAGAAPLDDLNAILEKQNEAETPSPISDMLDWDALVEAMNAGGAQVAANLTIPEELLKDAGLPEELQGDLGLTADTTVDLTDKQWLFKLAAAVNSEDIASLSLYGVIKKYDQMMDWLAGLYVNTLNLIQYMHDKYYYEAAEMALIDTDVRRTFATGIAGFSHVVDSLSAIKYAKVKTIRDESGLVVDYETEGNFPRYGNDDDRADDIAVWLLKTFLDKLKKQHTYRNSEPTTSILTITSNVVYGKATGSMPDGRKAGEPLAPGANPSYGAEQNGLLASLNSVAKLPYEWALDGISNTQTMNPDALGHSEQERIDNLVQIMDGYFDQGAHHLNVNVFGREKLIDAMEHPEKEEYANFTIRVSGYAVKFIDLTREQQMDVLARTCHTRV